MINEIEEYKYKDLNDRAKKLFEELEIVKNDKNCSIFANYQKLVFNEAINLICDKIKEEFIEDDLNNNKICKNCKHRDLSGTKLCCLHCGNNKRKT